LDKVKVDAPTNVVCQRYKKHYSSEIFYMQSLICHSATPSLTPLLLCCNAMYLANGDLQICYLMKGALDKVYIPEPSSPTQTDKLWQRTCFEAFIGVKGKRSYYEYNFSPSGQWAIYAFENYRQPIESMPQCKPLIQVHQTGKTLRMTVRLSADLLPNNALKQTLQLALTAVIEEHAHSKSYWALQHDLEKPDFHHRDGFSVSIKPF
jgi:hypothetical protein